MGDEDQRGTAFLSVVIKSGEDLVPSFGVERCGGFVGEDKFRRGDESPEDGDTLAFSLGQVGSGSLKEVSDVEALCEQRERVLEGGPFGGREPEKAGGKEAVFGGGQVVEKSEVLEDETGVLEAPSPQLGGGELVQWLAGIGDECASRGSEKTAKKAEKRGFAGATGAAEKDGLAREDIEFGEVEGESGARVGETEPARLKAGVS